MKSVILTCWIWAIQLLRVYLEQIIHSHKAPNIHSFWCRTLCKGLNHNYFCNKVEGHIWLLLSPLTELILSFWQRLRHAKSLLDSISIVWEQNTGRLKIRPKQPTITNKHRITFSPQSDREAKSTSLSNFCKLNLQKKGFIEQLVKVATSTGSFDRYRLLFASPWLSKALGKKKVPLESGTALNNSLILILA